MRDLMTCPDALGQTLKRNSTTSPSRRRWCRWSQKVAQLVSGHADYRENVPQRALGYVPVVDWHRNCPAIRVFHHVMAAADPRDLESGPFKCSDYLCPRTAGIAEGIRQR